jgi:hypothetical protein
MSAARAALVAVALAAGALGAPVAAQAHRLRFFGVVPDVRSVAHRPADPQSARHRSADAHAAELPYLGGPVLHSNNTHLIFWQPAGSGLAYDAGYQSLIERFLSDVASDSRMPTNIYGLSGQYRDSVGPAAYDSTYRGAVVATNPLPPNGCSEPAPPPFGTGPGWSYCLTAQQLENELLRELIADKLPRRMNDIYFLVLPDGLGSCEYQGPSDCSLGGSGNGGYCGYHSATSDDVPYAVIPYNAVLPHCQSDNPRPNSSTADPAISTISHEHNESITDPFGNAWVNASGQEEADLCITSFGPTVGGTGAGAWNQVINGDHYYLQQLWSNATGSCQSQAPGDAITFSAPRHGVRGARVQFSPRVSRAEAPIRSFEWFFGDRRRARRRRTSHVFTRQGAYRVVLRTTDAWGNWAFFARRVVIGS